MDANISIGRITPNKPNDKYLSRRLIKKHIKKLLKFLKNYSYKSILETVLQKYIKNLVFTNKRTIFAVAIAKSDFF